MSEVCLRVGYFLFNTKIIPTFSEKTKLADGDTYLRGSIYIKTNIPLVISISEMTFVLEIGEHYIPPHFHSYCTIRLSTDISTNNEVEVYYNCIVDDASYKTAYLCACNYPLFIPSLVSRCTGNPAYFLGGICGDKLSYSKWDIFGAETFDLNRDIMWLEPKKLKQNELQPLVSTFIKHRNIKQIQNDEEVTGLLEDNDRNSFWDFWSYMMKNEFPVVYKAENHNQLHSVLINKYGIDLKLPKRERVYVVKTYEELLQDTVQINATIDYFQSKNIFQFITKGQFPFTLEMYNANLNKFEKRGVVEIVC